MITKNYKYILILIGIVVTVLLIFVVKFFITMYSIKNTRDSSSCDKGVKVEYVEKDISDNEKDFLSLIEIFSDKYLDDINIHYTDTNSDYWMWPDYSEHFSESEKDLIRTFIKERNVSEFDIMMTKERDIEFVYNGHVSVIYNYKEFKIYHLECNETRYAQDVYIK